MNYLQIKLLSLLKEIDIISKNINIKWFLMYGSLLGAIRHNGFIPWDDDADIAMTYDDFLKFKDYCLSHPQKNKKLTCIEIDPQKCGQSMARFHDMEIEEVLKLNSIYDEPNGVYIDIFILDNYPNDQKLKYKYNQTLTNFIEYTHKRYSPSFFLEELTEKKYTKLKFYPKNQKVFDFIKKLSSMGEKDSIFLVQRYAINHIYKRESFKDSIYVKFEDTFLPVPIGFNEVLVEGYGEDWNHIPANHQLHEDNLICLNNTEKELITQKVHEKVNHLSNHIFHGFFKFINYRFLKKNRELWFAVRQVISNEISTKIKQVKISKNISTEYPNLFAQYISYQLSPRFFGRLISSGSYNYLTYKKPYLIDVPDIVYINTLDFLLTTNNLGKAAHYVKLLQQNKNNSERLIFHIKKVRLLCKINALINYQNFADALYECENFKELYGKVQINEIFYAISCYKLNKKININDLDANFNDSLFFFSIYWYQKSDLKKFILYLHSFSHRSTNSILIKEAINFIISLSNQNIKTDYLYKRILYRLYIALGYDDDLAYTLLKTNTPKEYFDIVKIDVDQPTNNLDLIINNYLKYKKELIFQLKWKIACIVENYSAQIGVPIFLIQIKNNNEPIFIIQHKNFRKFIRNVSSFENWISVESAVTTGIFMPYISVGIKNSVMFNPVNIQYSSLNNICIKIYIAKSISVNKYIRNFEKIYEQSLMGYSATSIFSLKIKLLLMIYLNFIFNKIKYIRSLNSKIITYLSISFILKIKTNNNYRVWIDKNYAIIPKNLFNSSKYIVINGSKFLTFKHLNNEYIKRLQSYISSRKQYAINELDYVSDVCNIQNKIFIRDIAKIAKKRSLLLYIRAPFYFMTNKILLKLEFRRDLYSFTKWYYDNKNNIYLAVFEKNNTNLLRIIKPLVDIFNFYYKKGYIFVPNQEIGELLIESLQDKIKRKHIKKNLNKYNLTLKDINNKIL